MHSPEMIQRDADSALSDLERLRVEILEFSELHQIQSALLESQSPIAQDLTKFRARIEDLLNRISDMLNFIRESPVEARSPSDVLPLSTLAQELKSQLEWLQSLLTHLEKLASNPNNAVSLIHAKRIRNSVGTALSKVKSILIPMMKSFISKLWTIITGLLTPKEWKLKGGLGTGLLGLANVELEITFGP